MNVILLYICRKEKIDKNSVFWRLYELNIKKVSVLWSRGIQSHYRDPSLKIIEILVQRGTDVRKKIGKPIAVLQ